MWCMFVTLVAHWILQQVSDMIVFVNSLHVTLVYMYDILLLLAVAGTGNDNITVNGAGGGRTDIDVSDGNDLIELFALGSGEVTVLGGAGNDILKLDARDPSDSSTNTFDGSTLTWNGGDDDDRLEMFFVSAGTTNLNITGDGHGVNTLIAQCSDIACTVLSRETFIANIHFPDDPDTTLERINVDKATASITTLLLYLNSGENSVHFDDTIATMVSSYYS